MRRTLLLLVVVLVPGSAFAVIKKLTPLKEVLDAEQFIFVAQVEKVEPDRPAVVMTFVEHLKGKAPFERLAINLTGDSYAKKEKETQVMLDRLAPKRQVVFFVTAQGQDAYSCFGYLEGTWFQLRGTKDGEVVRWAFLHCEPYFRRTYKGTTAELKTLITECLAGKRKPPEPNEKEPPGYGPVPEKPKEPKPEQTQTQTQTRLGSTSYTPPLFAVIPSFVVLGPLAIVAALFPGVAAGLATGLKRWRVLFVIAGLNSTLALVYVGLREFQLLPESRYVGPQAYGLLLLGITALGLQWAGRRYRVAGVVEPTSTAPPERNDVLILAAVTLGLSALAAATAWYAGWREAILLPGERASGLGKEFTAVAVGLGLATLYSLYRRCTRSTGEAPTRLSLSSETVALAGIFWFGTAVLIGSWPREGTQTVLSGEIGEAAVLDPLAPKLDTVQILYETADYHEVMSAVAVAGSRFYLGLGKQSGFRSSGAVVCVDESTGHEVWRFTDDESLKPVFATPTVADGHVYVGEGLHTDVERRLFRLDATTGKPTWPSPVATLSHTEGTARVVQDRVYFSAGDDGLHCVAVRDGAQQWHFRGSEQKLHIDTPPAVAEGRVYAGSGYRTLALLGLEARSGAEIWRTPVNLRSFGPPLVQGNRVYFGLGTGNLTEDLAAETEEGIPAETTPAGAIVCLDTASGTPVWRVDLPKSVHTALTADSRTLYASCRDGSVYAFDRTTGTLRWRRTVGSALAAGPVLATYAGGVRTYAVYAVSQEGHVVCLSPTDGSVVWTRDLSTQVERLVQVISTPILIDRGSRRTLLFGAMLTRPNSGAKSAALFRIEDQVE